MRSRRRCEHEGAEAEGLSGNKQLPTVHDKLLPFCFRLRVFADNARGAVPQPWLIMMWRTAV